MATIKCLHETAFVFLLFSFTMSMFYFLRTYHAILLLAKKLTVWQNNKEKCDTHGITQWSFNIISLIRSNSLYTKQWGSSRRFRCRHSWMIKIHETGMPSHGVQGILEISEQYFLLLHLLFHLKTYIFSVLWDPLN